jgi:hypothetical protein
MQLQASDTRASTSFDCLLLAMAVALTLRASPTTRRARSPQPMVGSPKAVPFSIRP